MDASFARRGPPRAVAWFGVALALALLTPSSIGQTSQADARTAQAIARQFAMDEMVPEERIRVNVADGIVTLSGAADNPWMRQRAAEIAQSTLGVRSVANNIEVAPTPRSDEAILRDVQTALARDPAVPAQAIEVRVRDGAVTLRGTVDSSARRNLAGLAVVGVRGVADIDNAIEVVAGQRRSDPSIEADVRTRLSNARDLNGDLILVQARKGAVRLEGVVGSEAERFRARSLAWVDGVTSVDVSAVEIVPAPRARRDGPSDEQVRRAVEAALIFAAPVISEQVTVDVRGGSVRLRGLVDSEAAAQAAEAAVRRTQGVRAVDNQLRVRTPPPDAEALLARVNEALGVTENPDMRGVRVAAAGNVVQLFGTVPSREARDRATDLVAGVAGVGAVDNNLTVRPGEQVPTDEQLERQILEALLEDPATARETIRVTVANGAVTLFGVVNHANSAIRAEAIARYYGARAVENLLNVRYGVTGPYRPGY